MSTRIVVTGIGVISPIGCGREEFWRALAERMGVWEYGSMGETASSTPTPPHIRYGTPLRSVPDYEPHTPTHSIPDFDPRRYLTQKGVKLISRAAQMAGAATALALADAGFVVPTLVGDRVGVVLGSAYANVNSMVAFDREAHEVGARFVSAMLFPDTLLNAPAGHISILFGWKGINSTICAGLASSLEAVRYACDALRRGDADVMLVGGCEESSQWVAQGFGVEKSGEGAAMFVLERWEDAQRRAAKVWAEAAGCGASFAARRHDETVIEAQAQVMTQALAAASLTANDIGEVFSSSRSIAPCGRLEALSLERVFGERAQLPPVRTLPPALGEMCGATGALLMAAAASALQRGAQAVMVNAFSGVGHNAATALKRVMGYGF